MKVCRCMLLSFSLLFMDIPSFAADSDSLSIRADELADSLIDKARQYIGVPYRFGGKGPETFDCSGFTRYVYGQFGYSLACSSVFQFSQGRNVEDSTQILQKGDLLFFGSRKDARNVGHVAIYLGPDEDKGGFNFIHAAIHGGILVSNSNENYYKSRFLGARRIIPDIKAHSDTASTAAVTANSGLIHPALGSSLEKNGLKVTFVCRKQNYDPCERENRDPDIYSPKSVNFHPDGQKFYVNSLEGGTTAVYDLRTKRKIKLIEHKFSAATDRLWAPSSGLFTFTGKRADSLHFTGKPVESVFTHKGRYLWVPYYRRSFDVNAREPSAVSVIDTQKDTVIRLFETGPLPKMTAVSPDGNLLAITHWGDNTVGIMDISSGNPRMWHYVGCYVIDYRLALDFSDDVEVNRDVNSGYCLRGTVFTPDNRYLLVGCMGGGGGIAVIDLDGGRYLGRILGAKPNIRHIVIDHDYLYASINSSGYVQRINLDRFLSCISELKGGTATLSGWESCKVGAGARTIVLSPDGRFIFAACNSSSCISVVDASSMSLIGTVPADSYPVGLDISEDGRVLISTSQGRDGKGGNAVDIFSVDYPWVL